MDQHRDESYFKMLFWSNLSFSSFTDPGSTTLSLAFSGDNWIKTTLGIAFDTEYRYVAQQHPTQTPTH